MWINVLNIGLGCSSFLRQPYKLMDYAYNSIPHMSVTVLILVFLIQDQYFWVENGFLVSTHNFSLANTFLFFYTLGIQTKTSILNFVRKKMKFNISLMFLTHDQC